MLVQHTIVFDVVLCRVQCCYWLHLSCCTLSVLARYFYSL